MADDGIFGMLSGMFGGGGGQAPAADPNAPMQILPQVQQDAMAQPSFLDALKASLAKNGPQAFGAAGQSMMAQNRSAPVAPLPPIQFPQVQRPQVQMPQAYGSMMPRIGS